MNKPDARRLSEESLQLLRSQAHRLRLDERTWAEIASIVGVSLGAIMVWARRYRLGSDQLSEENVVSLRRGRVQGANRTLSSNDEALLRQWIILQDRPADRTEGVDERDLPGDRSASQGAGWHGLLGRRDSHPPGHGLDSRLRAERADAAVAALGALGQHHDDIGRDQSRSGAVSSARWRDQY